MFAACSILVSAVVLGGCYYVPPPDPAYPDPSAGGTTAPATPPAPPVDISLGDATLCTIPPHRGPIVPGGSPQQVAEQLGLTELDNLVGKYLRGEVTVFIGTVRARDNTSAFGGRRDGMLAPGPALGRLAIGPSNAGDWYPQQPAAVGTTGAVLVVHGVADKAHVIVEQTDANPDITWVSGVAGDRSSSYMSRSCERCAPDLARHPTHLAFDVDARGTATIERGPTATEVVTETRAAVDLTVVQPCRLRFAHLAIVETITGGNAFAGDLGLADFHLDHGNYVAHREQPGGGASGHHCTITHPFSYDLVIDAKDLGRYSVRDFKLGTPGSICAP